MNLILWRHAEAVDGMQDMQRELTERGQRQAGQMARWLAKQLPEDVRVLVSPAVRTRQTADALKRDYTIIDDLAPGAAPETVLEAAGFPDGEGTVLVVGHQPTLGRAAALAVSGESRAWAVRKSGIWWLSSRERDTGSRIVVRAVLTPELLGN